MEDASDNASNEAADSCISHDIGVLTLQGPAGAQSSVSGTSVAAGGTLELVLRMEVSLPVLLICELFYLEERG